MQRREFITLLGTAAAAAWPFTTLAQQSERMRRVGVVMNLPEYDIEARLAFQVLRTRLQELGWAESNLKIDFRWVGEQVSELPAIVKDLVGLRPDVIVGRSGAVLLALHHETSTIPIVFVGVVDPVEVGLVESLARPGGNITGFATFDSAMGTKWFQIIKEIDPSLKRVAVLLHPQQSQELILKEIEGVAPSFSAQVTALRVHNAGEIENSINNFASGTDGGLIVLPNSVPTRIVN